MKEIEEKEDTIVALSTPPGVSALAVIRLSGKEAISICNKIFKGKDLTKQTSHTIHFGTLWDEDVLIDEVLISIFIAPKSFTKENIAEISCHGSGYIVQRVIKTLLKSGARLAKPGEFTRRAFLNGQFDLAQAEAIADLIHSDSEAAHQAAINQMRGGFSKEIQVLRNKLIHFASMIELELDFSEEDVEFASREELKNLIFELQKVITALIKSFDLGNVIKNGVPVVIAGKPNVGKSTLLNKLLNEEKAIVSEIPGTTRDFIEDELIIEGISFRFIDTAGLRETTDKIEAIGVQRTQSKMKQASLIIYIFDLAVDSISEIQDDINKIDNLKIPYIKVGNKLDQAKPDLLTKLTESNDFIFISADKGENIDLLKQKIFEKAQLSTFKTGQTIVTNIRHYESLAKTNQSLQDVIKGIDDGVTGDFLSTDIRNALHYLGTITGEISTEDLLANIFSKFCIGK